MGGKPLLKLVSSSALRVLYGVPDFDGGDPVVHSTKLSGTPYQHLIVSLKLGNLLDIISFTQKETANTKLKT